MNKINLSSKEILNKEFESDVKGYNALEVDTFLDLIIHDYEVYESLLDSFKNGNKLQNDQFESIKLENDHLKNELELFKTKFGNNPGLQNIIDENIELTKKINSLEKTLYNLGLDPNKIK